MNILNINFNEINAKRENKPKGQISIKNNVKISNLEESKVGVDKSKKTLNLTFKFDTEYENYATISLTGVMLLLEETEKADQILNSWEKDKKLDKDNAKAILQTIMNKSLLQTIVIAKELDLPAPVKFPTITEETKK